MAVVRTRGRGRGGGAMPVSLCSWRLNEQRGRRRPAHGPALSEREMGLSGKGGPRAKRKKNNIRDGWARWADREKA